MSINHELATISDRTTRLAIFSVILHAIAGYFILTMEPIVPDDPLADCLITEITWLQPEPVEVATADPEPITPSPAAPEPVIQETKPAPPPDPGRSAREIGNLLAARRDPLPAGRKIAEAAGASLKIRPSSVIATLAEGAGREAVDMNRDRRAGLTNAPPKKTIRRQTASVADIGASIAAPAAGAAEADLVSREISPGISLEGPVTGRQLLEYDKPSYPEWARQDGVEVTVKLYFTVLPDGSVKENVRVERTSGYRDFDQRAKASLMAWRFETLGSGATAEQWGCIEFNYRLKQAG